MIRLRLPIDGIEADIEPVYEADGQKQILVAINIQPKFYSPEAVASLLYIEELGETTVKGRYLLKQSGKTGRVSLANRSAPVEPAFSKGTT